MLAVGFNVGAVVMIVIGAAGVGYGLRSLRPGVREIEEFFRDRDRQPSRWSNLTAAGGTLFGLVSLLIGVMLVMFGVALLLLA
jgi:hypothetical protein